MRKPLPALATSIFFMFGLVFSGEGVPVRFQEPQTSEVPSRAYLGFDRNDYPGDALLGTLRKTFSFAGYWLNAPPGESSNSWHGKREILSSNGFGFLVLFNGRSSRQLRTPSDAATLGARDATSAAEAARNERFPARTLIFLDVEEGGRMLPEQRSYVYAWVDGVNAAGYRAGIYCSGIPAKERGGTTIVTANDLRDTSDSRRMVFFVYNDACPPSTGCVFPVDPPSPQKSGVPFAEIWQFAQSPRRRALTRSCPSNYNSDGNCYALGLQGSDRVHIDLDTATSPDPSSGRN